MKPVFPAGGVIPFPPNAPPPGIIPPAPPDPVPARPFIVRMVQTQPPPLIITVAPAIFDLPFPPTNGQIVGYCMYSGIPTSWNITAGNINGFWAIDNTGAIRVTNFGAAGIGAGAQYTLTVTASNQYGTSLGALIDIIVGT
jgi:hypothetical protein